MQRKNNRYQNIIHGYVIRGIARKNIHISCESRIKIILHLMVAFFLSLGKRKIGNEITVFKSDKYGKEVFKAFDFRIELIAFLMLLFGIVLIHESL